MSQPSPPAHAPKNGVAAASTIMAAGTMVSRVLGFLRSMLLAVAIGGTTLIVDIFERANTIPNSVYLLLVGGMFNMVLVPQLIKAAKKPDQGADYTSRLLTLSVVVMFVCTAVLTVCAYPILRLLTLGWSEPMLALGTSFALWTLPQVFFYGVYAVIGQILNANAKFGWYMWAPVLNNLVAITMLIGYIVAFGQHQAGDDGMAEWTTTQTVILAGGHTLGIAAQAAILIWPLSRLGLTLRPKFGVRGMGLGATGRIAAWTLLTMTIGNVSNIIHIRLISGATAAREEMGEDGASVPGEYAANIAELIVLLPHSVFVLSIATVLFNQMSDAMGEGRVDEAREVMNRGLRIFAIPIMFSTIAFVVLAGVLGRLFAGAAADADMAAAAIGQLLILFAVVLPFRSASLYMMRTFYAAEDAKTPLKVTLVTMAFGQVTAHAALLVVPYESMPYVVVAVWGAMNVMRYGCFHVLAARRWGSFGLPSIITAYVSSGWAAVAAGLAGGLAAWAMGAYTFGFAYDSILTAAVTLLISGSVMAVVYIAVLRVLRVREFHEFMEPIGRRVPAARRLVRL
ncbi:murein biosynthesis integral membrane protein MurJ [Nesterenkonia populi]|uniref:murein biosynthesis integral membrane protein MurJ n=1 Tax=Nesterenkonia populi TaxID=1591087 RepID=UPI0011BE2BEB|nr:lipid II flippase MurJ [Nesterenkonia populi]